MTKVMEKAEPVIFVSAPNYKLAGKKNIGVEEILNAPFYLTERNANYRQALEHWMQGCGGRCPYLNRKTLKKRNKRNIFYMKKKCGRISGYMFCFL